MHMPNIVLHLFIDVGSIFALLGLFTLILIAISKLPTSIRCIIGGIITIVVGEFVVAAFQDLSMPILITYAISYFCSGAVVVSANYPIAKFGKIAPLYLFIFSILLAIYVNLIIGIVFFQFTNAPTLHWLVEAIITLGTITCVSVGSQFISKRFLQISGLALISVGVVLAVIPILLSVNSV